MHLSFFVSFVFIVLCSFLSSNRTVLTRACDFLQPVEFYTALKICEKCCGILPHHGMPCGATVL